MTRYTFGDDDPARERLRLVAAAYETTTRAFLGAHVPPPVGRAVDLGCGPGYSTRLLAEVCRPGHLTGLDSSPDFLAAARRLVPSADFRAHDVTAGPLPGAPADLLYARLLLAHLPDPLGTAGRWREQLAPGGVLLLEDLDHIDAPAGPLRAYDELSAEVVRAGGGLMYAGAALGPLGGRLVPVTVPAETAARIYLFNVRRWLSDPSLDGLHPGLAALEAALSTLSSSGPSPAKVSWIVRQVVLPARSCSPPGQA